MDPVVARGFVRIAKNARSRGVALINRPGMTTRGKRIAALFACIVLFLLPKHVDCGYPDGRCGHPGVLGHFCTEYELEPLGFYLLERIAERDVGFAYSSGETCR
jgi:hypothetical protein